MQIKCFAWAQRAKNATRLVDDQSEVDNSRISFSCDIEVDTTQNPRLKMPFESLHSEIATDAR